jgi:hypothetical protein
LLLLRGQLRQRLDRRQRHAVSVDRMVGAVGVAKAVARASQGRATQLPERSLSPNDAPRLAV